MLQMSSELYYTEYVVHIRGAHGQAHTRPLIGVGGLTLRLYVIYACF